MDYLTFFLDLEKFQNLCTFHCVEKAGWTCKLITVEVSVQFNKTFRTFF